MSDKRHYEIVFLVHPDQSEQVPNMMERHKSNVAEKGGVVHRLEDLGRQQLAYPINKIPKAHYVLMNVECGVDLHKELDNSFRLNDAVLRHLIVLADKAITEPSILTKQFSQKKSRPSRHH